MGNVLEAAGTKRASELYRWLQSCHALGSHRRSRRGIRRVQRGARKSDSVRHRLSANRVDVRGTADGHRALPHSILRYRAAWEAGVVASDVIETALCMSRLRGHRQQAWNDARA